MTILTHTYPNGFRIIYEQSFSKINVTSIFLICDIGSVYEYDKMRGASHFIEHMCFKGTKKIPNSDDIFSEYSKIGADFNAFTSQRYTAYTIKCQDEYIEKSLKIVSDIVVNSTFEKKKYEKEHRVIIEENNNNENDPHNILNDELNRLLYKGSSYEYPVDTLEYHNKNNLLYKDLIDFYNIYYHPSNMVLSIVSHIPFKKIKNILKTTYFLRNTKLIYPNIIPIIQLGLVKYNEIQYKIIEKKNISNTLIGIGFRTCSRNSRDKHILMVLSKIMGGDWGRMMKVLREKEGLVYTAKCNISNYEHTGDITFFTETSTEKIFSHGKHIGVLELLIKIINSMKENPITNEEINNYKGNIKGNILLHLEDMYTQTQYNGEELLITKNSNIVPYSKIYDEYIHNITLEDIFSVINKYFIRENMCVCVFSNKLLELEKIKKECEKLR